MRRATRFGRPIDVQLVFLSTLSLRRATSVRPETRRHDVISIHALLAESDFHLFASSGVDFAISIHALLAESDPPRVVREPTATGFLSTLSLRRATVGQKRLRQKLAISIHALLAESDFGKLRPVLKYCRFLSTLSLRRATSSAFSVWRCLSNFYPRSPCGERPARPVSPLLDTIISIHALLAESDKMLFVSIFRCPLFLSTLSLRRATLTSSSRKAG